MIHLSRFIMRGKMCLPLPQTGQEWSKIPEWPTNWVCIGARLHEVIQFKNKGSLFMVPDSSVGKESTCNAGDSSSIPGLGRSTGEGIGFPLQYSWASLVAQLIKNLPAMWETWVWSLGWEDPLEKRKATYSSILAWRIPHTVQSMASQRVGHDWATLTFHFTFQDVRL